MKREHWLSRLVWNPWVVILIVVALFVAGMIFGGGK